jgi:hypothetical protein
MFMVRASPGGARHSDHADRPAVAIATISSAQTAMSS